MKYVRIIGFAVIGLLLFTIIVAWRNVDNVAEPEFVAQLPSNISGVTNAPVQIVEYADFGCPACRGWHNAGIMQAIQDKYGEQVSFEFRHFPIVTRQSPKAAEAAQCAAEQDKFWEYHDYLFEETPQGALSDSNLKDYASAIGLNRSQFADCFDSGKYASLVQANLQEARRAGAVGPPTFFVNGIQTPSMLETLSAQIDALLANQ